MKEFKGTKGPWHAVDYAGYISIQDGETYADNDILNVDNVTPDEHYYNGKLCAAAPELLEALQQIVGMIKDLDIIEIGTDSAEAAISKALD